MNPNPNFVIPADILRALHDATGILLSHSQLAQVESDDPSFPKPIILAKKRRYRRDEIERWLKAKLADSHVTTKKPSKREAAKRKPNVSV